MSLFPACTSERWSQRTATGASDAHAIAPGSEGKDAQQAGGKSTATSTANEQSMPSGQAAVPIAGVNLADYDNARIRCDYQETGTPNLYNARCAVVVQSAAGAEQRAVQIKPGLSVVWQAPQAVRGTMDFRGCQAAADLLTYHCAVNVPGQATLAEAGFLLQLQDEHHPPRQEASTLLLPYSVGIAAGFIPGMPYEYHGQASAKPTSALTLTDPVGVEPLGYQKYSFASDASAFIFPTAICSRGGARYFASNYSIYVEKKGEVSLYAGSANQRNIGNFTNRLRAFLMPFGLACTDRFLYVSSASLNQIFKIADDGSIQVVAGTGEEGDGEDGALAAKSPVAHPTGLAVDSKGNVIFAEPYNSRVRMITADGKLKTLAGNGAKVGTQLSYVSAITVGPDDSVYMPDERAHNVYRLTPDGTFSIVAGTSHARYQDPSDARALSEPVSVVVDREGALIIGEAFRGLKRLKPGADHFETVATAGEDIAQATLDMIGTMQEQVSKGQSASNLAMLGKRVEYFALAIDADGTLYTDGPQGIYAYKPGGDLAAPVLVIGAPDAGPSDCKGPQRARATRLFEASALSFTPDHRLNVFDWAGTQQNQIIAHQLYADGKEYFSKAVAGCDNPALLGSFNPTMIAGGVGGPPQTIGGAATAGDGGIYLSMWAQNRIVRIDAKGTVSAVAGGNGTTSTGDGGAAVSANLQAPFAGTFGPDGAYYFVELGPIGTSGPTGGSKIRKIDANGVLTTVAGTFAAGDSPDGGVAASTPIFATSVAVAADGRVFFADAHGAKIRMIDKDGKLQTIAGGGIKAMAGETIDAQKAFLSSPLSLVATNDGTLYFVNFGSSQVLQLKQRASDGGWDLSTLFGLKRTTDCGTARVVGQADAAHLGGAIKNSLSVICEGVPRALAIQDSCPAVKGETRIAISQSVGAYANVIEIVKPCAR